MLHHIITDVNICREFLVESAIKVGIEGAAEFLQDPNNGLKEVFFSVLILMLQFVAKQAEKVLNLEFCTFHTWSNSEESQNFIYFPIIKLVIDHATSSLLMFFIALTFAPCVCYKVNEELDKYSANITGVPYFVVGEKKNPNFMI
jgi:hypothetical protein